MKIKNIKLKNNLILAPMSGFNDFAFRELAVLSGADFAVTEMISSNALKFNNKKTIELLHTSKLEKIKVVQIFGDNPDVMAEACKSQHLKKFDIIDINMGCPVPKVYGNGSGCALMGNLKLAKKIIEDCVQSTNTLITVKFRAGIDKNNINAVEFAQMCEIAGASAITVHGRFAKQFYEGNVDLEIIKKVKESVKIPVIANGDVIDRESFEKIIKYTNCDAVMVGRAAIGRPWIFCEILGNESFPKIWYIKKHISLLRSKYSDEFILKHMRKHILAYVKGEKNSTYLKNDIMEQNNLDKIIYICEEFFKKHDS